jgi:uncharacterized protein YqgV (UPF0045/DUF77 family)
MKDKSNWAWIIGFIILVVFSIFFSSCKKNETACVKNALTDKQTVAEYYDAPVLTAIKDIQKAVIDPNIDGYQFTMKVDSVEEYLKINWDLVSYETKVLEQSTLNNIELKYNFIIDHYEGPIN